MKSTPQETQDALDLVRRTEAEISRLVREGKRVHIIWDFDGILASSLSDDVFEFINHDLERYFEYETRLFLSPPRPGIWLPLAKKAGQLHTSQDIVTGRSSFTAFRVMTFCLWYLGVNPTKWMRWILFLGHQSKEGSFRIILESLKKDPQVVVYFIDDSPKHVEAFSKTSQKLKMAERTVGIISPKIRDYTKEDLRLHYESVTKVEGNSPTLVPRTPGGYADGFLVIPSGLNGLKNILLGNIIKATQGAAVEKFGPLLEITFKEFFPDQPITPEGLYYAFRLLQEEAIHDTTVLNEIVESVEYCREEQKKEPE